MSPDSYGRRMPRADPGRPARPRRPPPAKNAGEVCAVCLKPLHRLIVGKVLTHPCCDPFDVDPAPAADDAGHSEPPRTTPHRKDPQP